MIVAKADEVAPRPDPTFPALYYAIGTYILATGYSTTGKELIGTVLKSKLFSVGEYSRSWSVDEFKRYHGTVTLTNKD